MHLPYYRGFYFAIAKNPTNRTTWHTCKEYAGRALGGRNPKGYVTLTIYNGYTRGVDWGIDVGPLNTKVEILKSHLNEVSKSFGKSNSAFKVFPVKDHPGCLQVRVPADWCHNRITAHLLLTHIRMALRSQIVYTNDATHLHSAQTVINYGKSVGLDKFNEEMRAINAQRRTLGIVSADFRWKHKNHYAIN